jgi:plasmid maintenance system antidote protein VapI
LKGIKVKIDASEHLQLGYFLETHNSLEHINSDDLLKKVFDLKRAKNPRYSVRAFARDINTSSSGLSDMLNGKKKLTPKIAYKLSKFLKLDDKQAFNLIVQTLQ